MSANLSYSQAMQVHFTPELEAKLTQSAVEQGQQPDELVQQVVAQYFGEDAFERGDRRIDEQPGRRAAEQPPVYRNGILLLPIQPGSGVVTLEHVNRLRDELL